MRRGQVIIGVSAFGVVALADGLAMLLPGPSSKLGGALLLTIGIA